MEIALVFILLGLILAVFLLTRSRGGVGNSATDTHLNQEVSNASLPKTQEKQPKEFDVTSAKHLSQIRVVSGSAYVVDGDTIKIKTMQIRLYGIDAPEMNHPYGKKAKWELHKICKGQIVRAEIIDEDDHGRAVARCYLPDGSDLSAEMVKRGLAIDWPKFSNGQYRHLETSDARKKLFLADARQKGRMHIWEKYDETQRNQ